MWLMDSAYLSKYLFVFISLSLQLMHFIPRLYNQQRLESSAVGLLSAEYSLGTVTHL